MKLRFPALACVALAAVLAASAQTRTGPPPAGAAAPVAPAEVPATDSVELPVTAPDAPDASAFGSSLAAMFKRGGLMMWPILLCSVVTGAFALERWVGLRRNLVFSQPLYRELLDAARRGDVPGALARCATERSHFAALVRACLLRAHASGFEMEAGLEEGGARVLYDLRRNCKPLAVVADVAPLLGLMGTVTGMIKAFDVVAKAGALGRTELLAAGISEALLTTAFGLIVAIPALIAYHIFRARAENLVREMEDACLEIVQALRGNAAT